MLTSRMTGGIMSKQSAFKHRQRLFFCPLRDQTEQLQNTIVAKDMLNWPLGFSCRTRVKGAEAEMHNARVLRCPDDEVLEQEARYLAATYRPGRETGTGTWSVHASTVSQ